MKKVLWLCSWYPHPGDLYEGDFIQRHAKAVSAFIPVTVFFTYQAGPSQDVLKDQIIRQQTGAVDEKLIFFRFKKTGFRPFDTFIYNLRYYHSYKNAITRYIEKEGLPALIHVHIPLKAGNLARWIKRKWGIPYIVSEHSSHYIKGSHDDFFGKSFFHRSNVKRIFKKAIVVTNVSEAVAKTLRSAFRLNDVRIIHNTVDTDLFYYRPGDISKFRFIHVSTLANQQKNIEGILTVVSQLAEQGSDFEMVIVGPASNLLKKKVARLNLTSFIKFTGEIAYPQVAMEMQRSSALVLFSRYENFPCVMIEALCCGLPVIASDTGGIKEAIDEKNGVLVESENEKQLLDAMNKVMNEYNSFNRNEIADEAKARFSYSAIGEKFIELYNEILELK